jgi:hypothetical protein
MAIKAGKDQKVQMENQLIRQMARAQLPKATQQATFRKAK